MIRLNIRGDRMALDGTLLHLISNQLKNICPAKINKIIQISETEVLFHIRAQGKNEKLMISTHSQYNRINLTDLNPSNLQNASNFVMVLRKHIDGGIIKDIQQIGLDRILDFTILAYNELQDECLYHLYIELMGKYANIILVENGKVMDALKRIPPFDSNKRPVFPGMHYELPEVMNKKDPFTEYDVDTENALTHQFHGFSPLLSRECLYRIRQGESFKDIMNLLLNSKTIYHNTEQNQYHCIPLTHLEGEVLEYPLMKGMDAIYNHLEEKERIRQQSGDLYKLVRKELAKNKQKLSKLNSTLEEAKNCEQYRIYGDLLFAYAYQFPNKMSEVTLQDFETGEDIKIPLNIKFDVKTNAKKYYQKYHKSKTAQVMVSEQISLCEEEIDYFTELESQLEYADFMDAVEIRQELEKNGYLKVVKQQRPSKKPQIPHFMTLVIEDALIHVGKNNVQNDYLTFHYARKNDLWFHAKDYHGSHVILQCEQASEELIRACAMLASYYSQGRQSSSVPVDYAYIRTLKKAKGKALGKVLLSNYKTIYIDPDSKEIKRLIDTYQKKK